MTFKFVPFHHAVIDLEDGGKELHVFVHATSQGGLSSTRVVNEAGKLASVLRAKILVHATIAQEEAGLAPSLVEKSFEPNLETMPTVTANGQDIHFGFSRVFEPGEISKGKLDLVALKHFIPEEVIKGFMPRGIEFSTKSRALKRVKVRK